ncbi:CocE/NonD family hydrolase [Halomicronema sp. CCY15110]|uniref:CocE/NonD family hydrolase n=1 Tax=Halomicronema sp. CCY15110 TaxID=2767773 RepID=UPI001950615E|nr:CocE/NonD family hydrolase [Halomicronema sp. CCY15110]
MRPRYSVLPKESVSILTRDCVRLDADVYRPDAAGKFPVLLMRQPYGRAIASTVVYAHPSWYAAHGFIVVIQDVRGRGTSEGEFQLFAHEVNDGFDTVEWAAHLPGSNGRVGMYGFSYQGMTQLFAAQAHPKALRAIAPAMVGYHPGEDWAYENGALLLQAGVGWAIQLAAETARRQGDQVAFQALYQASRQLPVHDANPACPEVLQRYAPDSFFHDWRQHPPDAPYWQSITPQLQAVDLPMLHIGGWFDPYLRGDVRLYQEMAARSQFPQPLWIGPWGHLPWSQQVGGRNFGTAANSPIDRLQIQWFAHWLRDEPAQLLNQPPVNFFEMGHNRWRAFDHWPEGDLQCWHFSSSGLAAMHSGDGKLLQVTVPLVDASPASATATPSIDTWVHDPWRPVPSQGGHAALPAGSFNRAAIDGRSDVLTYTSDPLPQTLAVAGHGEISLYCQCDRPSFDLSLTLSEVRPDGTVYNLTQGYGRFTGPPNVWQTHRVKLQPTCFSCAPGQALRVSISAASFPAYTVNLGGAIAHPDSSLIDAQIITLSVNCNHPQSYLLLTSG